MRVCRNWKLKGKKVDESISVEKNGAIDKYLGESWSYYIEEILPFGIARFFFFDNEKITQLADDASFEQIKTSIKSAIGVSTIEKAITHIDEVIRRKKKMRYRLLKRVKSTKVTRRSKRSSRKLTLKLKKLAVALKS